MYLQDTCIYYTYIYYTYLLHMCSKYMCFVYTYMLDTIMMTYTWMRDVQGPAMKPWGIRYV